MRKKLVYVGFAFQHHKNTHAGYHQICKHIGYDYIIDCQKFIDMRNRKKSDGTLLKKLWINISYRFHGIVYLFHIILLGLVHNNLVFHFIYGENIFYPWIKIFLRNENIVACTFHQPYSFFKKYKYYRQKVIQTDLIILVGQKELDLFRTMTGKDNVYYIPHGIDTDFYKPDNSVEKENMLLTVGNWLRDYEFADKVYQNLLGQDPRINIHVVANKNVENKLTRDDRLFFHHGISDEELLHLYRTSSVLFLPLVRYTANNSLLEAGATGCNIIVASNYPDNSYMPSSLIRIIPFDVDNVVLAIKENLGQSYCDELSTFVEDNYSWKITANNTEKLLRNFNIK